ncbi:MAG: response regulator, partial [Pedobacter sp.]
MRKRSIKRNLPLDYLSAQSDIASDKLFIGYDGKKNVQFSRLRTSLERFLPRVVIVFSKDPTVFEYKLRYSLLSTLVVSFLTLTFILFVAMTSGWIAIENRRKFLMFSRVSAERTQFLASSKAAIISRNQFLENVSHEIKTPLTAVLGYIRLLASNKCKIQSGHEEIVDHLEISAVSLLRTIDVLLDMNKLNAGQLALQESLFDIRLLLNKVVDSIKISSRNKKIDFQVCFSSEIPHLIRGDPERVEQIVFNLLENAVKFTNFGSIQITLSNGYPQLSLGMEKMLCISVTDTGIGIDVSKHAFIFRSFYQVDGSATRRHGGMGLGLAVSRMLANLMNGDLEFESDGSTGSTFKCWLPIRPGIRSTAKPVSASSPASLRQTSKKPWNVLVVDDDVYIRHYLDVVLAADGWIVELCESGLSAISKCMMQNYNLILMDIQMPLMTGIDASKIIWAGPRNEQTPILAMTGYLSTDRIFELRSAGLVNYLGKPLVAEVLLSKARQAVLSSSVLD